MPIYNNKITIALIECTVFYLIFLLPLFKKNIKKSMTKCYIYYQLISSFT